VFVAEGSKIVEAALAAGVAIEAVYLDSAVDLSPATAAIVDRLVGAGVRVFPLSPGVMERVSDTVTPQPLIAVVGYLDVALGEVRNGPVIVLVDVRDPGNVGAIIRSADASGAAAVVVCEGSGDPYNPKTVRASAGSLFSVPLVRGRTAMEVADELSGRGFTLIGAVARDGDDYATAPIGGDVALFFGNEANGLDAVVSERLDRVITVPIAGGAESLNVAMAATVICFDLARRRRLDPAAPLSMSP